MMSWEKVEKTKLLTQDAYVFYEKLSSGQVLGVFFQEYEEMSLNCAVCIMNSEDECIEWVENGGPIDKVTGNCGLEGLKIAYNLIHWFINNRLPYFYTLRIYGEGKRGTAYRFLTRLGFEISYSGREESEYIYEKKINSSGPFVSPKLHTEIRKV